MSKLLVITFPENDMGFRLAGVEVIGIKSGEEIPSVIKDLIEKDEYGVIAIEEDFLAHIPLRLERVIYKRGRPILVTVRSPKTWVKKEEVQSYIARLIRRAIGYQIKIKR